jgi:hypothetical protein
MMAVTDILKEFDAITLEQMDKVKFLDRMDSKFVFTFEQLPAILKVLVSDYYLLQIDGNPLSFYETLYYDTKDLGFYLKHQNGKLNRFKVRKRHYVNSNLAFFEIKFKNNKERTIKKRIVIDDKSEHIDDKSEKLLLEHTGLSADMLHPSIWVYYTRITLVNKNLTERLTIDFDMYFKDINKQIKEYPKIVIAELKQDRTLRSAFTSMMHKDHIANFSISKYCLGIAEINQSVKKNNFKGKILQINKMNYESN